jgi:ferrous iron transport protein A
VLTGVRVQQQHPFGTPNTEAVEDMNLATLPNGTRAEVVAVVDGVARRRLTELGVRRGAAIEVLRRAPFGGPLAIRVGGGLLALRAADAVHVMVTVGGGDDG